MHMNVENGFVMKRNELVSNDVAGEFYTLEH